jgi:hypothetical protein
MRDEIDGRIWAANHQPFADGIDDLLGRLRARLVRLPSWDGTSVQLFALVAAFLITALTFNTTSA